MSRSWTTTRSQQDAPPPVHPGEILAEELEELGLRRRLARQLAVPPNRITQIINGKRSITGDTALRFAHWFGTDPQFWLNLQTSYEIDVASRRLATRSRSSRPELRCRLVP